MPSYAVMPLEAFCDCRLSARDLRVLGVLYAHADKEGVTYPGRETIAEMAGMTARKVSASTARLADLGWLAKQGGGHRGKVTVYRLRVRIGGTQLPEKGAEKGQPKTPKECPQTVKKGAGRGQPEVDRKYLKHRYGIEIPSWVPLELWVDWLEIRDKRKTPNTERALKIALGRLSQLREDGHDPQDVIETAVVNGWKSFFPPRSGNQRGHYGGNGQQPPAGSTRKLLEVPE